MVDQAEVRTEPDGHAPARHGVARGTAEFLYDLATLGELQVRLLLVDVEDALKRLWQPVLVLMCGSVLVLGTLPVLLAAVALALEELTPLSLAASFGIVVGIALGIASMAMLYGIYRLRGWHVLLDRSTAEWRQNVRWAKDMLKRIGRDTRRPTTTPHHN